VIGKDPMELPAGTVNVAGTVAIGSVVESATMTPDGGAAPERATEPVAPLLPITVVGFTESDTRVGALTARVAVCVVPPAIPEIVATTSVDVAVVVTPNVAVVAAPATVTLGGTAADPLSLESATTKPPAGAADVRVTVPVEGVPPMTPAGLKEISVRTGGLIVRVVVLTTPEADAVIVALVNVPTATVVTVNVAVVAL
jgi:hypothetical protein